MTASWSSGLLPRLRPAFEALVRDAQRLDRSARVTSARRRSSEQARLYRRWLAGKSRFPVAPPGKSLHEQGRAIDLIAAPWVLAWLGRKWESAGGRWGGRFNDPIHFEF